MDDDDAVEEYDTEWCAPEFDESYARKFRTVDVVVLGFHLLSGISRSFTQTFELAQSLVAGHANYEGQREAFHEEAALELETLIRDGEDNG